MEGSAKGRGRSCQHCHYCDAARESVHSLTFVTLISLRLQPSTLAPANRAAPHPGIPRGHYYSPTVDYYYQLHVPVRATTTLPGMLCPLSPQTISLVSGHSSYCSTANQPQRVASQSLTPSTLRHSVWPLAPTMPTIPTPAPVPGCYIALPARPLGSRT